MNLRPLISQFWDAEKELKRRIELEADIEDVVPIDTKITDLIFQITDYRPSDIASLKEKFTFFIELIKKNSSDTGNSVALEGLVSMLNRDFDESSLESLLLNRASNKRSVMVRSEAPHGNELDPIKAFGLIGNVNDRVSIIDTNLHYMNTSAGNSEFYGEKPNDMIGKHVSEYIGESRFRGRAKRFFEKTLGGERQHYFHSLSVNGEQRIMSCQMLPLYETDGRTFGTAVTMGDISGLVADSKSLVLEAAILSE